MRRPIIAGNWKMYMLTAEAKALAAGIISDLTNNRPDVEVVLCPPLTATGTVLITCAGTSVGVGGQNLHWEKQGAFTGEVSAAMLKDMGCQYVIIGHSERRQYFGESNDSVNKKLKAALAEGLTPIVCVGEKLAEREGGVTEDIVREHTVGAFKDVTTESALKTVVAYEPVWAIGTGKTATPQQAQEVHAFIRKLLSELYDPATAQAIRIQYGGSVKPDNIDDLMTQPDIDGALVGGASLKIDSFMRIVRFQSK